MTVERHGEFLVVPRDRRKTIFSLIGALAFIAVFVGFIFILRAMGLTHPLLVVVCCVPILIFGLVGVYLATNLIRIRPAVIIGPEGVTDYSTLAGPGLVPWPEIKDLVVYEYMGQRFLGLVLKDPRAFVAGLKGMRRFLLRTNRRFVRATVNIPQTAIPCAVDELQHHIAEYARNLAAQAKQTGGGQ